MPELEGVASERVDLDGWDAHVLRWPAPGPDAPRVVLLHGGAGHAHSWAHLAAALAPRYEVAALDQRGHGRSGPTDRYGSRVLAADVGRLLDALKWPTASLVGHSMGGQAAYLFAAAHPERVRRLVVIDTGPESDPDGIARIRTNLQGPDTFGTVDEALTEARRWFPRADDTLLRLRVEHNLREQSDGSLTWRTASEVRRGTAPRDDHTAEQRWAAWRDLRIPTRLVHGADSDILTDALVARFTAGHPTVTVTRIADAGHSIPLEQPQVLAAAVVAFLGFGDRRPGPD